MKFMSYKNYINEKFTDESDPIKDMGIGLRHQIEKWLKKYEIVNYTINKDLTIYVLGDVSLSEKHIKEFPDYIQFNRVDGQFFCNDNNLISFRGFPYTVGGLVGCSCNNIKTLDYIPKEIGTCLFLEHNTVKFTKEEIMKRCKIKKMDHIHL
jgi:hypothetical protein